MGNGNGRGRGYVVSQKWILDEIQQDEQFVYACVTREGAVKIGCSVRLSRRKGEIKFGGVEKFYGYMPGGYPLERTIHTMLKPYRIPGAREYYYPVPELLPWINHMRDWMGIAPLKRKDLPRLAECTFHRRVQDAQVHGTSVFG